MQAVDFVVIGSGFGGAVSAMRLTEKGYKVVVLERGKRFNDEDFPRTNWNIRKYLWLPLLRCFGIQEITLLNDVMVLTGCGVGGGSLVYANVVMEPDVSFFDSHEWSHLGDWKTTLRPFYEIAKKMRGVATNPYLTHVDDMLKAVAEDFGRGHTFRPVDVGVFFGEPGKTVPDPYFDGSGPERAGCIQCGGCMIGCQHNAKNTLTKNYLYFAEKWGAEIRPEAEVTDIHPLPPDQPDGARYVVEYRRATARPFQRHRWTIRTQNVVVSAGVLGTLRLLFRCKSRSLPNLSPMLGEKVRTNSETLTGSTTRRTDVDYSEGLAITSVFSYDEVTRVEPVHYPDGSSLMRWLAAPMIEAGHNVPIRILKPLLETARRPLDYFYTQFSAPWAKVTTILLIMQTEDTTMQVRPGRNLFTLFRRGLVSRLHPGQNIAPDARLSHAITHAFARKTDGIPQNAVPETLLDIPTTAHILGGCTMGQNEQEGVVDVHCEVFNYPGLYVVDGSIVPANPGINPSLTITALAEYAMSCIPAKEEVSPPIR